MLFVVDGEKEPDAEADIFMPEADAEDCPDVACELLVVEADVLL